MKEESLVGVWVDGEGNAHLAWRDSAGSVRECPGDFQPFAWAQKPIEADGSSSTSLGGPGAFSSRIEFSDFTSYKDVVREHSREVDVVRPLEHQLLLRSGLRLFEGMRFHDLRRCQVDIETSTGEDGGFPDPRNKEDRVLAIGIQLSGVSEPVFLEIEEETDKAERELLDRFRKALCELDPDVIEGHNIFNFDLDFLFQRSRRFRLKPVWGRFGGEARIRRSRLRIAERWIDYQRCDIPGRSVFDTYLAVQLYDISTRDMGSYSLKESAIYFGITDDDSDRTYIPGAEIQNVFRTDRARFLRYLADDLRETAGLARHLLPTYVAQVQNFPMLLQEAPLRGTGVKVDLLLCEQYLKSNQALPLPAAVEGFAGGLTTSPEVGVFEKVLHFDVASLYPSLLLLIGKNPESDSLGVFLEVLSKLREQRLKFKKLAKEADDAESRLEYGARQNSYKILINSFYGYLGFSGARFADGNLAAEVTRRGRELLQNIISWFEQNGITVLEADTDGIYVSAPDFYEDPTSLLNQIASILPEGIDLEYDGKYQSMFCYKAKNYALNDEGTLVLRGSALRSRGIEPFLKSLTDALIRSLLGLGSESPVSMMARMRDFITSGEMKVSDLAKSESLSMSPAAYQSKIDSGGKPRRAALEVALRMSPRPKMGEKVSYFIGPKEKGMTSDWQRAFPVEEFDPVACQYDPKYYIKKLDDWLKRYDEIIRRYAARLAE